MAHALPARPPFVLRARVLTPLAAGGSSYEADGRIEVDAAGRIAAVGPWADAPEVAGGAPLVDLRPLLVMPGMVDLHVHLPQLPNAGVGAGLDLLTWLDRYIFPLERAFDEAAAERLAPLAFRAFAAAGTTTAVLYGAVFEPSLDAAFRAAEAHGIRAVIGKVMMDRGELRRRRCRPPASSTPASASRPTCARAGTARRRAPALRVHAAVRDLVRPNMLRESAELARETGAYWQTHVAEDRNEIARGRAALPRRRRLPRRLRPGGGLGPRTILAHAIHLSTARSRGVAETDTAIAHCPASNLFLASGAMPLARYLAAGIRVGLGSDVAARARALDLREHAGRRVHPERAPGPRRRAGRGRRRRAPLQPLDWLRLATYEGARALGQQDSIGSLEAGKEADMIAVDPRLVAPVPGIDSDDPAEVMSRLAFRPHPDMVRGAWVRGRRLDGPPG